MKHLYYTPIRPKRQGRKCLLIVKYPISSQNLALLLEWVNADERMHYSVLFLGERPNMLCEEETAFFRRGVECDFIWDENEVRLGLLLRYRLAMFSHMIIDNECSDALCELIFAGFNITTGTTFKFISDGISFGRWDKKAGTALFPKGLFGSLNNPDDDWYHSLNDAMKRACVFPCGCDNDSLFPKWLDAWADSYVDFLQANGNVPAVSMSSLARAIVQHNEAQWSEREDLIWLLTVFISRLKRFAVANSYNLDCDEDNIVAHVFSQKLTAPQQQLCYYRGHVICAMRFMQWLIQELVIGNNVYGLIENLVVDLYALNIIVLNNAISDLYARHWYGQRCGCPLTRFDHYKDAYRVAIYQHAPIWRTTAEIMGIAGLRQALESGFSRMIGLKWTDAHMRHDLIPNALLKCREIQYPNSYNNPPIDKIMLIYAWTNTAVHKALSDVVWLIWEAFNYCSVLFCPENKSESYNVDSAVQIPIKSLYEVRRKVTDGFCEWARVAHVNSVRIQWGKPEAVILDQDDKQQNWDVYEHCGMAITPQSAV